MELYRYTPQANIMHTVVLYSGIFLLEGTSPGEPQYSVQSSSGSFTPLTVLELSEILYSGDLYVLRETRHNRMTALNHFGNIDCSPIKGEIRKCLYATGCVS